MQSSVYLPSILQSPSFLGHVSTPHLSNPGWLFCLPGNLQANCFLCYIPIQCTLLLHILHCIAIIYLLSQLSLWIPSEINSYLFSHSTRHGANYRSYLTPFKQMNVDFYLWKWLLLSTTTIFYIYLLTHPSASSSPTFLMTPKFSLKHNSDHVLLNLRNFLLLSALPHLPSCSSSS